MDKNIIDIVHNSMRYSERDSHDMWESGVLSKEEGEKFVNKNINKNKLLFIKANGFEIDMVNISNSYDIPEDFKKALQIMRTLFHMRENIKELVLRKSRKTITFFGIKCKKDYYYVFSISFRRNKKTRSKPINFSNINLFNEKKLYKNYTYNREIPLKLRLEIYNRDNYTCQYCGWKNGEHGIEDRILSVDHIVPIFYGGTTKKENLRTCCLPCNIKKNDRILDEVIKRNLKLNKDNRMIEITNTD